MKGEKQPGEGFEEIDDVICKFGLPTYPYTQHCFIRNAFIRNSTQILSNFKKNREEIVVIFENLEMTKQCLSAEKLHHFF